MELQFHQEPVRWMQPVVSQIQTQEQTQELKLSDGMPDIGRVLSAWGQCVVRGKEWQSDGFTVSAGMLVWVLYAPEDGTQPRCIHGWIPFQLQWDLPSGSPDGQIRVLCLPRFVDARSVSPRKILVRAGLSALGEGYVPAEGNTYSPPELPEDVQLLENTYPVRTVVENGEKHFLLDEDLVLPPTCPEARRLVCCTLQPEITEHRVLSNRLVFRGDANLHALYISEEGRLHSWDFPLHFSQFDDLRDSHSGEAQADFLLMPTDLDVNLDDEGHFRLKCGLVAQYALEDTRMVRAVEDVYSPQRELTAQTTVLTVPAVLEAAEQTLQAEQRLPQEAEFAADVAFLPDFPRQRRTGDQVELEQPGMFQVLYYSPEGVLQSATARWEGRLTLDAHPQSKLRTIPMTGHQAQAETAGDGMVLRARVPLSIQTTADQSLTLVTGLELGQQRQPDPKRPSLILMRAGEESLWQLARENGSTVDAIRQATALEGEPAPGQMLLIPVL